MKKSKETRGFFAITGIVAVAVITAVMVIPAAAQLADTPWPMFHHDLNHTGLSPYTGPDTNATKWIYTTGDDIRSSPAIGTDGMIYVGSRDDKLYAIYPNGTLKWSYLTGHDIYHSSPAIGTDGTIYVGSRDFKLHAINPDGTLKWSYLTGNGIYSAPAIGTDGTIYVASTDKNLYAIYPNGTLKWSYLTGDCIYYSSPAIDADGTIYIGSKDDKLHAIYPNGTLKWSYLTGGDVRSSPAIDADGTIYVGSKDYKLHAIYPNGTLKWSYLTGNEVLSSPAIGSDGTIYVGSNDYKLYAINPDGTLKWSYLTGYTVGSSPAIDAEGTIYVGSRDEKLYAINPDGTLKWSYLTGGDIYYSSPAIGSDGTIYVGSRDDKLYAFGPGVSGKSDLTPTAITTPASIIATQSNSIEATIANIGSGNASSFNVSLSADGTPVDTASVDSLTGGGASTNVSFSWTPASAGGYELCVVADSDGAVDESDETNNGLCKGVTVVAAVPTNEVYFEPSGISASYCEERTVSVWANTSAATTGGKIVLNYTCCCANVTGWVRNASNFATGATDIYCGYASLTFSSTDVRGPGLVHIGDLTIHCCNASNDCVTDLAFVTDESELIGEPPDFAQITPVEWQDGTLNCTAPAAGPNITDYAPSSPVSDIEGATRAFNVTVNQTVNVSWLINGTEVQTNESVTEASYTNTSAATGTWNVSANASNANGTDMRQWDWIVTAAGICGDVNKDGTVNVLDATKVMNRAGNPSYPLDDEWAADVNCDTFINVLDATKVMNRAGNPGYPLSCCT